MVLMSVCREGESGTTLTPKVLKLLGSDDIPGAIGEATRVLLEGGLVVYPTDTSYGLACDPKQSGPFERLLTAKKRGRKLGVPLLFSDFIQFEEYHEPRNLERALTKLFWPGALTLLVTAGERIPRYITGGRESVAVRIPDHPIPRGIAAELQGPIVGTSANRSGGPSPFEVSVAVEQLSDDVDLYIDGGPSRTHRDSTIVSVEGPESDELPLDIKVYREGQLTVDKLTEVLRADSDALRLWTTHLIYSDM
jgi:tRNA threonylcarbamoyl adenosine modification protein (Sua5/YciO/YrdC/YwlC family)